MFDKMTTPDADQFRSPRTLRDTKVHKLTDKLGTCGSIGVSVVPMPRERSR